MSTIHERISVVASALTSDAREAPRLAREAGFRGVLFDAYSSNLNLPDLSQSGRREFRRVVATQAQALVGLQADLGPKGLGPGADLDRLLAQLDVTLQTAVDLGAGMLCLDLGALPAPAEVSKPKPVVTPEQAGLIILPSSADAANTPAPAAEPTAPPPDPAFVGQVDTALAALGEIADRYRTTVAFHSSLAGFAAIERAVLAARCPWFGIDLDPVAILRDRWPSDEIFSRLGGLIRHVRARDAVLGADRRTKPIDIGRGNVNCPELFASLDGAGYAVWLTVDPADLPDRRRAAESGLARLRAVPA